MSIPQPADPDAPSPELAALQARIAGLEQALAAAQARRVYHEQILANVNDAIIVVDLSFQVQEWNAAAERIYGWTAAEVIGKLLRDLLQPRYFDTADSGAAFAELEEQGVWVGQAAHRHRDGHELVIESAVRHLRDETGAVVGLVGINRDITARHQATAALKASEERFRLAVKHFPFPFVIYDAERRYQFVNTATLRITPRTEQELIGHRDEEVHPETVTREFLPLLQAAASTHTVQRGEVTVVGARARYYFDVTYVPLLDAAGELQQILVISHDLTPRVEAEKELRRSEANLRAFFDSAPQSQYLLDTEYRVIAFNRVAAESVRQLWQTEIKVGDLILDYASPANREAFIANYQRCLGGEAISHERHIVWPNGQASWYELSYMPVYRHGSQEVIGVAFSGLNISARKEAEQALAKREAELAGIIDSAMDAIITADAAKRIVLFNRAAEQMFGWPASALLGQLLSRVLPFDILERYQEERADDGGGEPATRSSQSSNVLTGVRANGDNFPIEASISQNHLDDETFYTVILRDLTERQRLEAQLIQAQKMESVGHLAGGIAHDFNNLLMAILGYTDLLKEGLPPESPFQEDVQEIQRAGERASELTRQLLAFARKQRITPQVLDLRTLLANLRTLLRRLINESIEVVLHTGPQAHLVKADQGQIEQVLVNLAINARDAMPNGGTLTIATDAVVLGAFAAQGLGVTAGAYVQLVVADTGTGMTEEVQKHIFEPFFTTKEPGKGTGLGLATCYGIIKQHGGAIVCESRVGYGTTFKIYLPALSNGAPDGASTGDTGRRFQGDEAVLLVEDEPTVRGLIARVLRSQGYNVSEAGNGAEALVELLREPRVPIDLVLTDMVMPGMSGATLAERVQALRPDVKVVFMSGYTDPMPGFGAALSEGVVFLQKPVLPEVLLQKVREALDS